MTTSSPHPDHPTSHEDTAMPQQHEQDTGPMWSAATAARRTGVGRATITRRLQAGQIPGATRDEQGHWQIPPAGLRAAGLDPDAGAAVAAAAPADAAEVTRLRAELAAEQQRRAVAETQAAERAEQVTYLRGILDRLTAGMPVGTPAGSSPSPARQQPRKARQRARTAPTGNGGHQDTTGDSSTPQTATQRPAATAAEQRILQLRDAGESFSDIAATLNAEGVPTATGTGSWHRGTVNRVHSRLQREHDHEQPHGAPENTPPAEDAEQ